VNLLSVLALGRMARDPWDRLAGWQLLRQNGRIRRPDELENRLSELEVGGDDG
jgi:hypothetical protein